MHEPVRRPLLNLARGFALGHLLRSSLGQTVDKPAQLQPDCPLGQWPILKRKKKKLGQWPGRPDATRTRVLCTHAVSGRGGAR